MVSGGEPLKPDGGEESLNKWLSQGKYRLLITEMVCLRAESLTHHTNQMKLFNAIATTAVIGASLATATPVEAASPWDFFGRAGGLRQYGKLTDRSASTVKWTRMSITDHGKTSYDYWLGNCRTWTVDVQVTKGAAFMAPTADVPPGTTLDAMMTRYCS